MGEQTALVTVRSFRITDKAGGLLRALEGRRVDKEARARVDRYCGELQDQTLHKWRCKDFHNIAGPNQGKE